MGTMNIRVDDRRSSARFEIVGSLRGALELDEPARVIDIDTAGALVESRLPVPLGPLTILITVENRVATQLPARVQQVRRASEVSEASRYLITIVFLSDITPYLDAITRVGPGANLPPRL